MRIFIHSSWCVLNFMLSVCRPNFAEVTPPRKRLSRSGLEHIPNGIEETPEEANSYSADNLISCVDKSPSQIRRWW